MATMRESEIVEASHEPGRDAFHRVRNLRRKKSDAVERVPTQWFMVFMVYYRPDSQTKYSVMKSSFNVIPRPGPCGTVIQPFWACIFS